MVTKEVAGIDGQIITVSDKGRRIFSKFKLFGKIREYGYWPQVKAWLVEQDMWDAFVLAQTVDEGNPDFDRGLALFKAKFGLTDEQVEELLEACKIDEIE